MKKVTLELLLKTKTALLGAITPSLRAVTVGFDVDEEKIYLKFFYDEEISDELIDIATSASAEVELGPEYSYIYMFDDEIAVQLNYPIPMDGALAYLRKEPNTPFLTLQLLLRTKECLSRSYLAYALQQALLGRVILSLRSALSGVDEKNKIIKFYFYYEEEISDAIQQISREAIIVAAQPFSEEYKIEEVIECLPWPAQIPNVGDKVVFERKEEKPPWAFLKS